MAVTSIRLTDGELAMTLYPRSDAQVLTLDAPGPDIRTVTEARPDDEGMVDTTTRYGSRAVSLEIQVIENPATFTDELNRFLHPGRRPYLVVADDEWSTERRLMLRSEDWSGPLSADNAPFYRRLLVQWRAPDGVWEASEEVQQPVGVDVSSRVGRTYPRTYPYSYAPTTAGGAQEVVNVGNTPSHMVARLYGPVTAPVLTNETTGQSVVFDSALVLGSGEYVEISTRNRTAFLNGDVLVSRLGHINFGANSWWQLQAGVQRIRYTGASPSAGARAVLLYRPSWL